ncbi:uncharacterized protein LOC132707342 [Cylas formicarius]|uniref:uncharacterized protein LOC132707342 n=1 Tax=Cylas formicarius TaxID=197179 RepID=UPI0029584BD8|nr:uncharacterized protein LOC132707342 [Cylas formicarius]
MYVDVLAGFIVLFLVFCLINNRKDPKRVFGIYSRPGKWYFAKYPAILTLLFLRRFKFYLLGKDRVLDVAQLEKLQPLSSHPLAFDAVFFHAVSQNGVYICGGTERRQDAKVSGLLYVLVPDHGLLLSSKLPDTVLDADAAPAPKEYAAEGIKFTPVEPMRTWRVSFAGKMRLQKDPARLVDVDLKATWTSDYPWFLYEVELPLKKIARSIALEPWTEDLFRNLKDAHQTHYEQMGYLEGTLKVDGKETRLSLDSFRDHSYGFKRDWSLMHRYIFHMFYLSNQTRITLGLVCQPCTSTDLEFGYVVLPNRKLETIDHCDLVLYQHGENGTPSDELCFTFEANDTTYEVKVTYEVTHVHFKGKNREAKMFERFFKCEVNGVTGRGISEWHYNVAGATKRSV